MTRIPLVVAAFGLAGCFLPPRSTAPTVRGSQGERISRGPDAPDPPAAAPEVVPRAPSAAAADLASPDERLDDEDLARWSAAPALSSFEGRVSYYHDSLAGNRTANGETYRLDRSTAAHRTLPFGTILRVTRRDTAAAVVVRVNDRGPFGGRGRVLDLSRHAAEALDMIRAGVVRARVDVLHRPERRRRE